MSFLESLIVSNCIVIAFNIIGLFSEMKPPKPIVFFLGWAALVCVIFFGSNA